MSRSTLFVVLFSLMNMVPAFGQDSGDALDVRQHLEKYPLNSSLTVVLQDGTKVSGLLAELAEEDFGLWVEPEKGSVRHRNIRKVKRHIPYASVARVLTRLETDPLEDLRQQAYLYRPAGPNHL